MPWQLAELQSPPPAWSAPLIGTFVGLAVHKLAAVMAAVVADGPASMLGVT
jgi:hypothetical protein